jgi:NADH:ubiquinone oxidoreductase subunit 4 (subunit M)
MNLVILGIFSFNTVGLEGAIVQSLSHGFVASALFVLLGLFTIGIEHVLLNITEDWLP